MDISLLYKLCTHELLPEELEEVRRWAEGDPRRQAYLDRFRKHDAGESCYYLSEYKKKDYRKNFLRSIGNRQRRRRLRHRIFGGVGGAVAATALILLLLHGGYGKLEVSPVSPQVGTVMLECEHCCEDLRHPKEAANNPVMRLATGGMKEIVVGRGDEFEVELSDGSHVWLNSDSRLWFPEHFEGDERRVYLEGEAFFSVSKDSKHPFIVDAKGVNIKVYGTEFNVTARHEGSVRTTLVSGSVAVKLNGERQETILIPGLTAEANPLRHSLNICQRNTELYAGWKDGKFNFEDTPLRVLFEELALWYDLQVDFETAEAEEECFTGSLSRNMPLVDLLKVLQGTTYVSFRLEDRHLVVGANPMEDVSLSGEK